MSAKLKSAVNDSCVGSRESQCLTCAKLDKKLRTNSHCLLQPETRTCHTSSLKNTSNLFILKAKPKYLISRALFFGSLASLS